MNLLMRLIFFFGLGIFSVFSVLSEAADSAVTAVTAIYVPAGMETISGLPGVVSETAVFNESESAYLRSVGQEPLSRSVKVVLSDREAFERLQKNQRAHGGGVLQLNAKMELHAANPEQWGLNNTGAPQQVEVTDILSREIRSVPGEDAGGLRAPLEVPGHRILVAVVDTGVDAQHPTLQSRLHRTESECAALASYNECLRGSSDKTACHQRYANLDTDSNGYPLDCSGWSVLGPKGSGTPTDEVGHGTHVSGIIGAHGFVSGVANEVEILPVKVIGKGEDSTQTTAFADVVSRGVLYAIRSHAQVMNLSLGYSLHDDSELMRRMVRLAQEQGILVVAAAGNQSSKTPVYPCRYAGVICVASFSADGSVSHFSDFGDAVDLAAPGHKILSSWPTAFYSSVFTERKGFEFKSGTSMAAPFVAGALARLLNHGFSPQDSYARLILGARPTLAPTAMAELVSKFTLSGNLDLARAFDATPQPLILPAIKEPVLLVLDRMRKTTVRTAPFRLALKNFWRAGTHLRVDLAIAPVSIRAARTMRFEGGGASVTRNFETWAEGATQEIEGQLSWGEASSLMALPGEFYFEVTVSGDGMAARTFKKAAEFIVPIRPLSGDSGVSPADPGVLRIASDLDPRSLPGDYAIKPISCLGSSLVSSSQPGDLLLISRTQRFTDLKLLKGSSQGGALAYTKSGGTLLDGNKEKLFAFSCLDYDQVGVSGYVVTSVNPVEKKFQFTFFDPDFKPTRSPIRRLEFSSDTVALPEDFRWLSGAVPGARGFAPAWLMRGKMPASELPGFDPWETRPATLLNPSEMRLYVLKADGLHTIKPPEGFQYVSLLKATATELRQGSATVLLAKGQGFELDFYTVQLRDLQFAGDITPLRFSIYHRLMGLKTLPVLGGSDAITGTAFIQEGAAGRMRLSLVTASGNPQTDLVRPLVLEATKPGDLITRVVGVFGEASDAVQVFFRSRFEMYYCDERTQSTGSTDLKQYDGVTRHLPILVGGRPALLMPEGQGGSLTTEVIVATVSAEGTLELERPAALKTWGLDGCELIQMLMTSVNGAGGGSSDFPDRLTYFCGDHFVQVLL